MTIESLARELHTIHVTAVTEFGLIPTFEGEDGTPLYSPTWEQLPERGRVIRRIEARLLFERIMK
jgi:hypothetical protein